MSVYGTETGWSTEAGLQEWESVGEWEAPASHEWESEGEGESLFEAEAYEGEWQGEGEDGEIQLAQELLAITNEQELEQFLGKLVRSAGKFLKSNVGRSVVGVLRNVAKTALPIVGGAIGSFVAPGVGTALGGQLGSMASKLLEVNEQEMLGEAEAEYEAARKFVRFGRATVRYAAAAPANVPPNVAARSAAVSAARRYAPALIRSSTPNWRTRRDDRWSAARPTYQGYQRRPQRRRTSGPRRAWAPAQYAYGYAPWAASWPTDPGWAFGNPAAGGFGAGPNGDDGDSAGFPDDSDERGGFEF